MENSTVDSIQCNDCRENVISVPTVKAFINGLPWVVFILLFSVASWFIWERFFQLFMNPVWAQYASIGMGTQGALFVCILALAGNWPFQNVQNNWARGISLTAFATLIAGVKWLLLGFVFKVNLEAWGFPIIATTWFFFAATSFIGADAHLADTPPLRRMFLNLVIMIGGTVLVLGTIGIITPFWFGLLEVSLVSGGFAYLFRRVKQPVFSLCSWSALALLTSVLISIAAATGHWTMTSSGNWAWNIGAPSGEFGVFFALTAGFNFSVNAINKCWPFSRIKQPWGYLALTLGTFTWCIVLAYIIIVWMRTQVPSEMVLWQSSILAWQTVFWGFAWVYAFGAGQTPYLWAGQKTPGTWDDVE